MFAHDGSSPAVIVWPDSIEACILFEGIAALLHDEIRIPVQTLFSFHCLAHHAEVRLTVLLVAVVWSWKKKQKKPL